jgi:pimeloyl-ACP methyl ester carboxylesterase
MRRQFLFDGQNFHRQGVRRICMALILAALLWLAGCAARPAQTPQGPELALKDCQLSAPGVGAQKEARCGKLEVFEDRQAGAGRRIELNVAVIPAVSRSPAPDPIFFLAGGPGEAATEAFLPLLSAFERIHQKRDIVLVDQRGTGGSHPLECDTDTEETGDGQDDPEAAKKMAGACLEKLDANPRLYTTAIAMDDLDDVRQALGYAQINLYGASYGTRAALAYLRQHPQHVRAVILDGVAPPNWTLGPDAAADGQQALQALFDRCAAQAACQTAFPDLPQEFAGLLAQLEAQPAVVALEHPVSGEPVTYTMSAETFGSIIHSLSYVPETAALLPLMIHQGYAQGDLRRLAAASLSNSQAMGESLSNGMRFSVICAEDVPFYPAASEAPAAGYLGSFVPDTFREICQAWPRGDIPAGFKDAVASDAPVLILSGGADPVTPPENGELAARALPNSRHVVLDGMGHVNIFRGCLPGLAADFIEQGSAAGLDLSCAQAIQPLPVFTNPNGPPP